MKKTSNTVRRDKLWRLCEAGRLELTGSYHFDDQHGGERTAGVAMPVMPDPGDFRLRKEGVAYLRKSEFDGGAGRAWKNPDGTVTLYVHSNSNYTLRIKPEEKK